MSTATELRLIGWFIAIGAGLIVLAFAIFAVCFVGLVATGDYVHAASLMTSVLTSLAQQ